MPPNQRRHKKTKSGRSSRGGPGSQQAAAGALPAAQGAAATPPSRAPSDHPLGTDEDQEATARADRMFQEMLGGGQNVAAPAARTSDYRGTASEGGEPYGNISGGAVYREQEGLLRQLTRVRLPEPEPEPEPQPEPAAAAPAARRLLHDTIGGWSGRGDAVISVTVRGEGTLGLNFGAQGVDWPVLQVITPGSLASRYPQLKPEMRLVSVAGKAGRTDVSRLSLEKGTEAFKTAGRPVTLEWQAEKPPPAPAPARARGSTQLATDGSDVLAKKKKKRARNQPKTAQQQQNDNSPPAAEPVRERSPAAELVRERSPFMAARASGWGDVSSVIQAAEEEATIAKASRPREVLPREQTEGKKMVDLVEVPKLHDVPWDTINACFETDDPTAAAAALIERAQGVPQPDDGSTKAPKPGAAAAAAAAASAAAASTAPLPAPPQARATKQSAGATKQAVPALQAEHAPTATDILERQKQQKEAELAAARKEQIREQLEAQARVDQAAQAQHQAAQVQAQAEALANERQREMHMRYQHQLQMQAQQHQLQMQAAQIQQQEAQIQQQAAQIYSHRMSQQFHGIQQPAAAGVGFGGFGMPMSSVMQQPQQAPQMMMQQQMMPQSPQVMHHPDIKMLNTEEHRPTRHPDLQQQEQEHAPVWQTQEREEREKREMKTKGKDAIRAKVEAEAQAARAEAAAKVVEKARTRRFEAARKFEEEQAAETERSRREAKAAEDEARVAAEDAAAAAAARQAEQEEQAEQEKRLVFGSFLEAAEPEPEPEVEGPSEEPDCPCTLPEAEARLVWALQKAGLLHHKDLLAANMYDYIVCQMAEDADWEDLGVPAADVDVLRKALRDVKTEVANGRQEFNTNEAPATAPDQSQSAGRRGHRYQLDAKDDRMGSGLFLTPLKKLPPAEAGAAAEAEAAAAVIASPRSNPYAPVTLAPPPSPPLEDGSDWKVREKEQRQRQIAQIKAQKEAERRWQAGGDVEQQQDSMGISLQLDPPPEIPPVKLIMLETPPPPPSPPRHADVGQSTDENDDPEEEDQQAEVQEEKEEQENKEQEQEQEEVDELVATVGDSLANRCDVYVSWKQACNVGTQKSHDAAGRKSDTGLRRPCSWGLRCKRPNCYFDHPLVDAFALESLFSSEMNYVLADWRAFIVSAEARSASAVGSGVSFADGTKTADGTWTGRRWNNDARIKKGAYGVVRFEKEDDAQRMIKVGRFETLAGSIVTVRPASAAASDAASEGAAAAAAAANATTAAASEAAAAATAATNPRQKAVGKSKGGRKKGGR